MRSCGPEGNDLPDDNLVLHKGEEGQKELYEECLLYPYSDFISVLKEAG